MNKYERSTMLLLTSKFRNRGSLCRMPFRICRRNGIYTELEAETGSDGKHGIRYGGKDDNMVLAEMHTFTTC
jgi:hypothetical protein